MLQKVIGIGLALCFVSLYPVVALLLSILFLGEKINILQSILVFIMIGCAVILGYVK